MKLENYKQASAIVKQIWDHMETLHSLDSENITVVINEKGAYAHLMTIGAHPTHEHEYTHLAVEFIDKMKAAVHERIKGLNQQLEAL